MIDAFVASSVCAVAMVVAVTGARIAIVVLRDRQAEHGTPAPTDEIVEIRACSRWAGAEHPPIVGVRTSNGSGAGWIGGGCPAHGDDADCVRTYRLAQRR